MNTPTFKQTKFLLAAFIILVATGMAGVSIVMAWLGKAPFMDAPMWWAVALTVFTAYGGAHVVDTHLQQGKQVTPENQQT